MTGFEGHAIIGAVAGSLGAGAAVAIGYPPAYAGGAFIAIFITSLVPDIDVSTSVPRRWFSALLFFSGILVAWRIGAPSLANTQQPWTPASALVVLTENYSQLVGVVGLTVVGIVGAYLIGCVFDVVTTHRGFMHSLGFGVLLGSVFTILLIDQNFPIDTALLGGVTPVLGVASHVYIGDKFL